MAHAGRFLLRRLALLAPLLLIIGFVTFVLLRLGGQDPSAMLAGPTATIDEIARMRADYGLDKPMPVQFGIWLGHVLRGDLGRSWLTNRPVATELLDRVPPTLELLLAGVGGCTAYDVVLILKRGRHDVRGCSVKLSAQRAESDPKVFTHINLHFTVTGRSLAALPVERAIALSHEKYCSASIMLGKTAEISTSFALIEG